ncbi:MAG: DegV family protein [Bacillota bacterium]
MSVLFIDTNCELWWEKAKELKLNNIIKMPYTICDEQHYYDLGENYDPKKFFDLVRQGNTPFTSCLNPENYKEYFEPFFKKGEDILYISFSDQMSATFESMDKAVKELKEKYPDAKFTRFDTKAISMAAGLAVYEAAKMYNDGKSFEDILKFLQNFIYKVNAIVTPESLKYLKRGGRLSSSQANLGTLLQIKPIIKLNDNGKLVSATKVNGRKKALNVLAEEVINNVRDIEKYPIVLLDADAKEEIDVIEKKIKAALPKAEIWSQPVGPVIGTHCGPGTIAVCYVGEKRN